MTTAVVDNKAAWRDLFVTLRADLLRTHLPLLRHAALKPDINTVQQELIYSLCPKDALSELMPQIIDILNRGGLRSRRLVKTLMRLNEKTKWLDKAPYYKTSFLQAGLEGVTFRMMQRNGEMTVKYAVLKFFYTRMSTLVHMCEEPENYVVSMNNNAVYHWIFTHIETDTRYNSITLLQEIRQAHATWLAEYRGLMQQLGEV